MLQVESSPWGAEKRAVMGGSVDEAELDDGVAEKIAGLLLLRLVPTEKLEGGARTPGTGGVLGARPAPASSKQGRREVERLSGR
jgi:hypothetical protein